MKICSDDRAGKEDRFWCEDPRCRCEEKAGTVKQEPDQLVAARLEAPTASDEEIDQTLARLQSPSYYIPGDGSIEGTGSEPEKPSIRESVSRQTLNDMNYESYINAQASDGDPLILN